MSDQERPHHPYSPSTLGNREVCPCYEGVQSKTPHRRTTAGTKAHAVVETGQDDATLFDEDATAAAECLDFVDVRRRMMEFEAETAFRKAQDGPTAVIPAPELFQVQEFKEVYLPIDDLKFDDCEATTAGYPDRIIINHSRTYAEVFDWKFGLWPVEKAEENLQGWAYVLGAFRRWPALQIIKLFFKQPHLNLLTDHTFHRTDVEKMHLRIQVVVARAREAKKSGTFDTAAPHVPVCNFCANLGRCPKVLAIACRVGAKFHPVEIPPDITPTMAASPENTKLLLRLSQVVAVWAGAVKRQITDRILRGEAPLPPGQRIQQMSKRSIVDMIQVRAVALKYMDEARFNELLEVGLGAVEQAVSDLAPRGQKKSMVEEFGKALESSGAVKRGDPFSFLRSVAEEIKQTK